MMQANRTILQHKFARIVSMLASRMNISNEMALGLFYDSITFELLNEGVADLHCMSDEYLVDELLLELNKETRSTNPTK